MTPAPTYETFGDWLEAERKQKNLTASELARRVGVKPQYIHNLEKNVPTKSGKPPKPSPRTCINIANALGVHYLEVMRRAGHVPDDIPESEMKARMAGDYVVSLPDDKQEEALGYLKFLFEKFGDRNKMRERSPKHPAVVREKEHAPAPVARTTPQKGAAGKASQPLADKGAHSKRAAKNGGDKRR